MGRTLEIITPEQVAIRYELAGFGSRAVAAALDFCWQLLIYFGIISLIFLIRWLFPVSWLVNPSLGMVVGFFGILLFFVTLGYYSYFETVWSGETPGKRKIGLRVIKEGGYPVDLRAVLLRNLVRVVDALPIGYGVAFVAVIISARYQRLGDLAAGTLVVRKGEEDEENLLVSFGAAQVFRLLEGGVLSQVNRVERHELEMVQQFLSRRSALPFALRAQFAQRLSEPLMEKIGFKTPESGVDYERWLEEVELACRRRVIGVAPTAAAPTPAPVAPAPITPPTSDERRW